MNTSKCFDWTLEMTSNEPKTKIVVSIKDNRYIDSNGVYHSDRTMRVLARKSKGFDFFKEECENIGIEDGIERITNYLDVEEGVYEIKMTNICKDFETGYLDDWDYELIPYEELTLQKPS